MLLAEALQGKPDRAFIQVKTGAAIAWVASQGEDIVPLVGARTVERIDEAMRSPLRLPMESLSAIEEAIPKDAVRQ